MSIGPSAGVHGGMGDLTWRGSGRSNAARQGYALSGAGSGSSLPYASGGGGGGTSASGNSQQLSSLLKSFSDAASKESSAAPSINFSNPSSVNASTAVNPLEQEAADKWRGYESSLADGTNAEITRELQRARDELSVGLEAEGAAAVGRGADAGFFKSRRLEAGKRDIHNLQGRLADVALGRRAEALSGFTGAAGQAAGGQRQLHLGEQAARLGEQRLLLDQAETQARLREAPYDRLLRTMQTYSSILGNSGASILGY